MYYFIVLCNSQYWGYMAKLKPPIGSLPTMSGLGYPSLLLARSAVGCRAGVWHVTTNKDFLRHIDDCRTTYQPPILRFYLSRVPHCVWRSASRAQNAHRYVDLRSPSLRRCDVTVQQQLVRFKYLLHANAC